MDGAFFDDGIMLGPVPHVRVEAKVISGPPDFVRGRVPIDLA